MSKKSSHVDMSGLSISNTRDKRGWSENLPIVFLMPAKLSLEVSPPDTFRSMLSINSLIISDSGLLALRRAWAAR